MDWKKAIGAGVALAAEARARELAAAGKDASPNAVARSAGLKNRQMLAKVRLGTAGQLAKIEQAVRGLGLRIEATCVPEDSPPIRWVVQGMDELALGGTEVNPAMLNDEFVRWVAVNAEAIKREGRADELTAAVKAILTKPSSGTGWHPPPRRRLRRPR